MIDGTPAERAAATSRSLFESAPAVVLAPSDDALRQATAASAAVGLGLPMLLSDPGDTETVTTELKRLDAETIIVYGTPDGGWQDIAADSTMVAGPTDAAGFSTAFGASVTNEPVAAKHLGRAVAALDNSDFTTLVQVADTDAEQSDDDASNQTAEPASEMPELALPESASSALVLGVDGTESVAALASARAAGAEVHVIEAQAVADPRAKGTVKTVRAHHDAGVIALGSAFGTTKRFATRVELAMASDDAGMCGQIVFPQCRMVALYGKPDKPELGVLGEQDQNDSITRVKTLADEYREFSDEPIQPAFEYIATMAASAPGPDGNYSIEADVDDIMPWVRKAEEAGVYVVLDLQPGRTDFLTQAKAYEKALKSPNVGLALDAEWRLGPGQLPLEQIGSVGIDEVNGVVDWLADLTKANHLPQKVLLLHQFRRSMIQNRSDLNTDRDEVALLVHADGHGTPELKMNTWQALQTDLGDDVWMGWKNFYDEDTPTFTPEQTMGVTPKPWFVSYQ